MILPSLRSAMSVVLCALARCLSRKRDSTSMVMLADAQPRNSTPWKIGIRNEMMGKPVSGLIDGSVTASVPRRLGGLIAGQACECRVSVATL